MAAHRIRHILSEEGFALSVAHIRWQHKDRRKDVGVVERRTGHGHNLHEQVGTDLRWVGHGQGDPVAEIGSHDRDGGIRHNDGVLGYDDGMSLPGHVAGNPGAEGDGRSSHSPEGKDDDHPVVEIENGRSDRCVESHPEAVIIVSSCKPCES